MSLVSSYVSSFAGSTCGSLSSSVVDKAVSVSLNAVGHNAAVENNNAVEVCISDLVELVVQLEELLLSSCTVNGIVVCTVSHLVCESLHSLENGVCLCESAFKSLYHGDTVLSVLNSLSHTGDLASHFLGYCETCSVIACAVDCVTGRKFFQGLGKLGVVDT